MSFSAATGDHRDPSFDQVLQQLKGIVAQLEQGQLSLEQAMAAYEQGVQLAQRGQQILAAAEHRVDVLMQNADGTLQLSPLEKK